MAERAGERRSVRGRRVLTAGCLALGLLYADALMAILSCGGDGSAGVVDGGLVDAALVDGGVPVDPGDAAQGEDAAPDGAIGPGGEITLRQSAQGWTGYAYFAETYPTNWPSVGGCLFQDLSAPADAGVDDAAPVLPPTAGDITIRAPLLDGGAVIRLLDAGGYGTAFGSGRLFEEGQPVSASAAGGTIPAFTLDVAAPGALTLAAPAGDAGPLAFPRDQDLRVRWTGGGAASVFVGVSVAGQARYAIVQCLFAAPGGEGVVPAALLGRLDRAGVGQGESRGTLAVAPIARALTRAGAYGVALNVEASSITRSFVNSN